MARRSRFPVVLVDLDGTMTDSAPGVIASFRHAVEAVGFEVPAAFPVLDVVGPPMIDTLASLGVEGAIAERALAAYFERYGTLGWQESTVYDGIPEALAALRGAGARLAVATSKAETNSLKMLRHHGLEQFFEVIGTASDDGTRRRKADVIAHALRELGIPVERAARDVVMVGDRIHDVEGASAHGISTISVTWGYGSDTEHAGARWVASSPERLIDLLLDASR
ncbi:HAD-IA family hydrolase [Hoyosella sp. G463]|uniref:HAD-IA family hydrolase n=1 Tax=Lolliginicoccus lacisalsi TaxID=2742202 RepID=A0A927PK33_9ACTN|nr:HAD-IA family hydrolase [Lolliginicoccus lacisalsi]MBD8505565.1 HAD-IA family hydrolase [Lolliginicoccus lacisalsi]